MKFVILMLSVPCELGELPLDYSHIYLDLLVTAINCAAVILERESEIHPGTLIIVLHDASCSWYMIV